MFIGIYKSKILRFFFSDANTIGLISGIASVDWGCALQIMAAVKIGTGGTFSATNAQLLYAPPAIFSASLKIY